MSRAERFALGLCAVCVFVLVQCARVRATDSDAQLTLLASQQLLETGSLDLGPVYRRLGEARFAHGRWKYALLPDGRVFSIYPLGNALAALPVVALARALGLDMADWDHDARVQVVLAGGCCGAILVLLWLLLRDLVGTRWAWRVAPALVLGSSLVSSLGTAFWSFDVEVLLQLFALRELAAALRGARVRAVRLGVSLAAAWICRPTAMALVVPALACVALCWRASLAPTVCSGGLLVGCFAAFCQWQFGQPLPGYYGMARWAASSAPVSLPENLATLLLSPARGLLVFTPFLALGLLAPLLPRLRRAALPRLLLAWFLLLLAGVSSQANWWGGWSFGPRLLSEAVVPLGVLAALVLAELSPQPLLGRVARAAATVTLVFGLALHTGGGLFRPASRSWNDHPDIDRAAELYRWNWRHTQILASEARNRRKAAELEPLAPTDQAESLREFGERIGPLLGLLPPGTTLVVNEPAAQQLLLAATTRRPLAAGRRLFTTLEAAWRAGIPVVHLTPPDAGISAGYVRDGEVVAGGKVVMLRLRRAQE